MNYKNIFKHETKVIAYVVIALTIVLIGSSYAFFFRVRQNDNNQVVQAGALVMTYKDESKTIEALKEDDNCLMPKDDDEGNNEGCLFQFTMTNTGTLPSIYTLYLQDDRTGLDAEANFVNHEYIKYTLRHQLVVNDSQSVEDNKSVALSELTNDEKKGRVLTTGKIGVKESITFYLRIWITDEAPTDIVGYNVRLKLDASSVVDEDPYYATNIIKDNALKSEDITGGSGVASVSHSTSEAIAAAEATNPLEQTEYRYFGPNPSNYVTFNGEQAGWRIVGLVNTPEGQRVKLIKNTPLDKSNLNINGNFAMNNWDTSPLKTYLNETYTLNEEAQKMIDDNVTWGLGSSDTAVLTTDSFYSKEHENAQNWKGKVALMYPSDYGYSTSGNTVTSRNTCLAQTLDSWNTENYQNACLKNSWLYQENDNELTLVTSTAADNAFTLNNGIISSKQEETS